MLYLFCFLKYYNLNDKNKIIKKIFQNNISSTFFLINKTFITKKDNNKMSQSNPVNQIAQDLLTLQATGALTSLSSFGSAAAAAAAASVRQSSVGSVTSSSTNTKAEFFSETEASILRSREPILINETEEITALGQRGIWANRKEVSNWKSDVPITEYFLNEDSNPEIIFKKAHNKLEYVQELAIRYLRPPTPPAAGEIVYL